MTRLMRSLGVRPSGVKLRPPTSNSHTAGQPSTHIFHLSGLLWKNHISLEKYPSFLKPFRPLLWEIHTNGGSWLVLHTTHFSSYHVKKKQQISWVSWTLNWNCMDILTLGFHWSDKEGLARTFIKLLKRFVLSIQVYSIIKTECADSYRKDPYNLHLNCAKFVLLVWPV